MSKENNLQEKITSNGVKYIAELARLGLAKEEIEKHQKEFLKFLDYVEKLKEADTTKIDSINFIYGKENITRKDKVLKFNKKLINGHLKVRRMLS